MGNLKSGVLKRIDTRLAKQIKDFAVKNNISFRKASEELAKINSNKLTNRKIIKEIRF